MPKPYTYVIHNDETGQFYVGVRTANVRLGLTFADDTEYWSSSHHVAAARKAHPTGWTKHLLAEYDTAQEALRSEHDLVTAFYANPLSLNEVTSRKLRAARRKARLSSGGERIQALGGK